MNELSMLISGSIGLFSLIMAIMIYFQLSTLNNNQVKTNILLSKIYRQSGGKLNNEDLKTLNK